jgi:hypothetical protein
MNKLTNLFCTLLLVIAPLASASDPSSRPASSMAGHYYLEGGPTDVGSQLVLRNSGQFEWALMYGAADYSAKGSWQRSGKRLVLLSTPTPEPVFRMFGKGDYHITKPAESGLWIAIVGVPNVGPVADMEVRFEAASGKSVTAVSKPNGDAIVKMPSTEVWKRTGLRRAGSATPWQWFPTAPERSQARLVGFILTNLDAVQHSPFTSLTLKVEGRGLVIDDPESRLRGTYARH